MKFLLEYDDDTYLVEAPSRMDVNSFICSTKVQGKAINLIGELVEKKSVYFYTANFSDLLRHKDIKANSGSTIYIFKSNKHKEVYNLDVGKKAITLDKNLIGYFVGIKNVSPITTSKAFISPYSNAKNPWNEEITIVIAEKENIDQPGFFETATIRNLNKFMEELNKKTLKHLPKIIKLIHKQKEELLDKYAKKLQDMSNNLDNVLNMNIKIADTQMKFYVLCND